MSPPTCARLRSSGLLRRLRAAPPKLQLLRPRLVPVADSVHAEARQHAQRLRNEALQALVGLLAAQRHLRRHDALPLDDEDALLARAVLEAAVALVTFEPRQHAVVAAPRALGGPLQGRAGLRHRSPHVQVRGPVAVHILSVRAPTGDASAGGRREEGEARGGSVRL